MITDTLGNFNELIEDNKFDPSIDYAEKQKDKKTKIILGVVLSSLILVSVVLVIIKSRKK